MSGKKNRLLRTTPSWGKCGGGKTGLPILVLAPGNAGPMEGPGIGSVQHLPLQALGHPFLVVNS